ncbi:YczE/YyaS/YitT family protein [Anaeroselena agilis]|uniref:Membrane protein n=1 Tax=Anaeroselena agilis TaxID=3063788 RepID=A0ABU3P3U9_9FIRM|nr:membrane protein [Selenomonadales bacterium 4137-cl]
MIVRMVSLLFGLCLFGLGIVLTVKSNMGTGPWDAFHLGLINYLPLTLGQVSQLTGVIVIALSALMGIHPGWGTIANMYFIGVFIDLFMASPWISAPLFWPGQLAMLLGGVLVIGWGSYFYLTAALGAGPRDSFMVGAIHKTGWPVWKVRTILETSVAAAGYLLGGPIGIGTLIVALTLGPSIQLAFTVMGKRVQDIRHDSLMSKRQSSERV